MKINFRNMNLHSPVTSLTRSKFWNQFSLFEYFTTYACKIEIRSTLILYYSEAVAAFLFYLSAASYYLLIFSLDLSFYFYTDTYDKAAQISL